MKLPLKHEQQFCSGCPLRKNTQKKTLYIPTEINYRETQEDGKPKIDVLIVAETPGFNEDYQGRPLVSDAGIEIHNAIEKAGLGATTAYTTAVRCRPTDGNKNRPPVLEEIAACKNYVLMDINYLQPKVVVLVGNVAVQALCPNPEWKDKKINAIKGEVYAKDGITYLVTVNPSTYLHSNSYIEKKRFEDSIKNINRILSGEQQVYARKGTVQFLGTLAEVKDFVDLVKTMPLNNYDNVPGIGYDTETRNLNRYAANELISMQFALDNNIGFFIPVNHPESPFKGDLVDKLRDLLIDLFTFNAPFEYWIAHNGLFDLWRALHFLKIKRLAKRIIDTLYVEYLRDENQRSNDEDAEGAGGFSRIDLKTLSRDKLAFYHYDPYVLEARKQPDGLWNLPLYESGKRVSRLVDYGGMDSYVGRRLLCHQVVDLGDYSEAAMRLALKWDARVSHLYAKMEKNGIYADRQQLDFLGSEKSPIITRLKEIPTEILDTPEGKKANKIALQRDPKTSGMKPLFGKTPIIWNIAKKAHKQALLIDACGLEPVGFGKDKVTPSIDKAFYQHHKDNPLVQKMQEFTGLEKLRTSYVNSVIRELDNNEDNKVDGRVHAHFHSTRTVTGRGATTDPNLGQIPRCLVAGTYIQTENGLRKIDDLVNNRIKENTIIGGSIRNYFSYENQDTYELIGDRNYIIKGTENHRLRVFTKDLDIIDKTIKDIDDTDYLLLNLNGSFSKTEVNIDITKELNEVDNDGFLTCAVCGVKYKSLVSHIIRKHKISCQSYYQKYDKCNLSVSLTRFPKIIPSTVTKYFSRLLGYLVSEGYVSTKSKIQFCNKSKEVMDDYINCWYHVFGEKLVPTFLTRDKCWYLYTQSIIHRKILEKAGLTYEKAIGKSIPTSIFASPREHILEFLSSFIMGDGSVKHNKILMFTKSEELANGLQALCTSLGYVTSKIWNKDVWWLRISGESARKAIEELNLLPCKKDSFNFRESSRYLHTVDIPYLKDFLHQKLMEHRVSPGLYKIGNKDIKLDYVPTREDGSKNFDIDDLKEYSFILKALVLFCPEKEKAVREILDNGYIPIKVVSKQKDKKQKVYDIETITHYYVANSVVSHNSDNHAKSMIKSMYGADLGRMIIEADYAQSEVRWWAQISGDEEFAALFHRMKAKRMAYLANPTPELAKEVKLHCDVHRQVASIMHQITLEEVTKPLRQGAKNLTFGSLYGQYHTTLAGILGITKEKALELQNTFVKQFTRAGNWLTEIENFAVKNLYVDSPFGRRRHLEPMFRINEQAAKRRARNSPIQAASSDTMFLAACRFQEWLEDNNLDHIIRIVNTVHDAIILDVPIDYDIVHLAITNLERCMVDINDFLYAEFGIKMIVPMESDFKMGKRWGHCFDLDAAGSNVLVDKIRVWDDRMQNGTPWYYIATEMHANDTVKKAEKAEKEFLQAKENGDSDIKKKKKEAELARKNADTAQQMFESLAA